MGPQGPEGPMGPQGPPGESAALPEERKQMILEDGSGYLLLENS